MHTRAQKNLHRKNNNLTLSVTKHTCTQTNKYTHTNARTHTMHKKNTYCQIPKQFSSIFTLSLKIFATMLYVEFHIYTFVKNICFSFVQLIHRDYYLLGISNFSSKFCVYIRWKTILRQQSTQKKRNSCVFHVSKIHKPTLIL